MTEPYDRYYQTENLFGEPYPELIGFFSGYPDRGSVLDLGCGQGRNAITLARMGYHVTGVDRSSVGIDQMLRVGTAEQLDLTGLVGDIYRFDRFNEFDIILLDSMFHFTKKDKAKEVGLIETMLSQMKHGAIAVFCVQDIANKIRTLDQAIDAKKPLDRLVNQEFSYTFVDHASGHRAETAYRMVVVQT